MTRIVLLEKPDKLGFGQEIMVLLNKRSDKRSCSQIYSKFLSNCGEFYYIVFMRRCHSLVFVRLRKMQKKLNTNNAIKNGFYSTRYTFIFMVNRNGIFN